MSQSYKNSDIRLLESDFEGLPLHTQNFIKRILKWNVSSARVFFKNTF